MNHTSNIRPVVLDRSFVRIFAAALTCITAHAANLTWDITPGAVGGGDSLITGGTGTWDLATGNWTIDGGVNNLAWTDGDSAIFGDVGGTVTLGTPISVDTITFNSNYTIAGGTLTFSTATPTITANAAFGTISSVVAGANGLSFNATGGIAGTYLDGVNTYSGVTNVNSGFLVARNSAALGSSADGTVVVSGATLQLENAGGGDVNIGNEALTISGTGVGGNRGALASWAGNNTVGGTVSLAADSSVHVNTGTLAVNGVVGGAFGLSKTGGGELTLGGAASNTFTGTTILDSGNLVLAKTGGAFAIIGNVQMGNGAAGNQPNLRMAGNEQFGAGVVMTFVNPVGSFPRFDLQGTTQTLAGIADATGAGVIQNEKQFGGGTAADATLNINPTSGTFSFNGWIRDEDDGGHAFKLGLAKSGAGTQELVGGNITYTGATTVSNGTLRLTDTTAFGSDVAISGTGTLNLNTGGTMSFGRVISGTGTVTRTGGTMTINGAASNTFSGTTIIDSGTTILGKTGGAFAISGPVQMGGGNASTPNLQMLANEQFGPGVVMTFVNTTPNAYGRFDLQGTTQTLAGVNDGGNAAAVIQNERQGGGGTTTNATLNINPESGTHSFSGWMRDEDDAGHVYKLNLVKSGAGTQVLSGGNITYTGTTTVNGGVLQLINTPGSTSAVTVNGGVFHLINTPGLTGAVTVNNTGTFRIQDTTSVGSAITVNEGGTLSAVRTALGGGARSAMLGNAVTLAGGTLSIDNAGTGLGGGWTTFNVANGLVGSGTININTGVLSRDNTVANAINTSATVNVAAGAFFGAGRGGNSTIGALNGAGVVSTLWGGASAGSITIGNGDGSGSFSGTLDGNGTNGADLTQQGGVLSVIKVGTGTQTLTGANTYSGTTTVNGGSLVIQNLGGVSNNANLPGGNAFTTSTLNVASGATVEVDLGATSLASTNSGLTLSGAGTIRKNGAGTWWLGNGGGGTAISMAAGGLIDIQGGIFKNDYANANWSANNGNLNIATGATVDVRNNAIRVGALTGGGLLDNAFSAAQTLTVGAGDATGVFTGNLTQTGGGALSVTKIGTGSQTLSGANTYTGTTTINGGTLKAGSTSAFPVTSVVTLANAVGANFDITGFNTTVASFAGGGAAGGDITLGAAMLSTGALNATTVFSGAITGSGGNLIKYGTGTLTLDGSTSNTYSGLTTIYQGAMTLAKTVGTAMGGSLTFDNNLSPDVYTTVNNQFAAGAVASFVNDAGDHGRLELTGTTQTLAGIQTVGYTSIRGVIQNSEQGNAGNSTLVINGSGAYAFSGYLRNATGTLALTMSGSGTQTLSGSQITYTGPTTVNGGKLVLQDTTNFVSATTVNPGGTLGAVRTVLGGGARFPIMRNAVTLAGGTLNIDNAGDGLGGGWITFNQANGLTGSGTININSGVFSRDNTFVDVINTSATVNVAAGAFFGAGRGGNSTIGALNGAGVVSTLWAGGSPGSITIGNGDGSGSFSGTLDGNGTGVDLTQQGGVLSVIKVGTGTQTLSGVNTYTGATTVNGGTLRIAGGNDRLLSSTSLVVNGGATFGGTFDLNARSQTVSSLTGGSGTVPGVVTNSAAGTGTLSINTGGTPQFDGVLQDGGAGNILALSKLGGGSLTLAGSAANTFTGTTILDNGNLFLNKPNGVPAISGPVQMGGGNGNSPNLRMLANEQFGPGVVMTFVNAPFAFGRFDLQGTTQTLAGVDDGGTAAAVIQNERAGGGGTTGPATLNINPASGTHSFNGWMRDRDGGAGTYLLNLVKSGAGTQVLAGGNITYTGTTTVNGGVLHVINTPSFNSAVTVNNTGTFRIQDAPGFNLGTVTVSSGGTLGFRATNPAVDNWQSGFLHVGSYTITKDGAGWFQFRNNAPENFSGLIRVEQGRFGNANNNTVWTNSTADAFVAAGAELDLRTDDMILDQLTGSGDVINTFFVGENNTLTIGIANGSSQFDGIIRGTQLGGGFNNISVDAGRNSLAKVGTGTFTMTGANTYVGTTTITGGTLQVGDGGASGNLGTGAVTNNAALIFNRAGTSIETAPISGSGTVSKLGAGLVGLTNPTHSGATTISDGILRVTDATAWNSDTTVNSPGALEVANSGTGTVNFNRPVVGTGGLSKFGAGIVRLNNNATYTGPTNVTNGVLQFNDATSFASSAITTGAGGYFELNRTTGTQTLAAPVSGAGGFTKSGAGELILGTALTNSGNTSVRSGSLVVTAANQLSASGTLTVGGSGAAVARLNGFSQTIGGLAGSLDPTNARIVNGSSTPATLTVNLASGQSVFSGSLGGPGADENNLGLVKQGAGTLVLNGQSTHTGGLTISGGTVQLGASTTLPASIANVGIWLDGADPAATGTAPADGALISTWKNKGTLGASGDFSAAAGFEPSYGAAGPGLMNNNPTVRFTASPSVEYNPQASYDKLTNAIDLSSGASTILVAGRYSSGDAGQNKRLVSALGNNWLLGWWNNGVNGAYYTAGFVPDISGPDTNAHTYTAAIRGDGTGDTVSEAGRIGSGVGFGPNGLALGGGYNPATPNTENSTGDVGELIVVKGSLAESDRAAIEAYLARKWTGAIPTNPLPTTGSVTLSASGATLAVNGVTQTIGALSGVAGSNITLGGGALTVGDATNTVFAGTITGSGAFTKVGNGTLELSGTNTPTGGPVLVQGGTLRLSGSLSGSLVEVKSGGTLTGNGTIGGDLYITGTGKLSPGTLTVTGTTLDFSDAVFAANTHSLLFTLGATSDRVNLSTGQFGIGIGVLEFDDFTFTEGAGFGPGTYTLFDSNQALFGSLGSNLSGTIVGTLVGTLSLADSNNDIILTVVPEPGSAALLLGGLAMLASRRRRK